LSIDAVGFQAVSLEGSNRDIVRLLSVGGGHCHDCLLPSYQVIHEDCAMIKPTRFAGFLMLLIVVGACVRTAQADSAVVPPCAVWQGCGQWDNTVLGGFNLYNNIWGSGAGPQCIWAR
jgi:hypothetical protein